MKSGLKLWQRPKTSFAHSRGHTFIKQTCLEININYIERINLNDSFILPMDVIEP